ncbi:878_t:CDS:2, partial [Racocetra persica]
WSQNNVENLWMPEYPPSELFHTNLTEDLNSPEEKLKIPVISNVLINVAYITLVPYNEAIDPSEIIAIDFGRKLWGEPGKIIISILISLSAFGCVDSIVFMGSRAIVYAAKNGSIPEKLSHKKHDAPFYALLVQSVYCAVLIFLP